jgi:hypothetical protein
MQFNILSKGMLSGTPFTLTLLLRTSYQIGIQEKQALESGRYHERTDVPFESHLIPTIRCNSMSEETAENRYHRST